MPRVIDHNCNRVDCKGTRAKWYGRNLHCTTCDAWQKEKQKQKRKEPKRNKKPIVYDGGLVLFGACVHCGCAVEECEC